MTHWNANLTCQIRKGSTYEPCDKLPAQQSCAACRVFARLSSCSSASAHHVSIQTFSALHRVRLSCIYKLARTQPKHTVYRVVQRLQIEHGRALSDLRSRCVRVLCRARYRGAGTDLSKVPAFKRHEEDCGSTEVQIARLTARVVQLTSHLKVHRKDFGATRGLVKMLGQRRRLMTYLYKESRCTSVWAISPFLPLAVAGHGLCFLLSSVYAFHVCGYSDADYAWVKPCPQPFDLACHHDMHSFTGSASRTFTRRVQSLS